MPLYSDDRRGLYGLGESGYTDIGQLVKQLNSLGAVTHVGAEKLIDLGMGAINAAIEDIGTLKLQDGRDATRVNIRSHLQWHSDHHNDTGGAPDDVYAGGWDLRDWVVQAFQELNAAAAGTAAMEAANAQFFSDAWDEIQNLPTNIGKVVGQVASGAGQVVGQAAGGILSGLFKNPIGLGAIAVVGFLVLKGLKAKRSAGL